MKKALLFLLPLLLIFWSCEKGNDEDIVIIPDPPVVYVSVQNNGVLPYNSSTTIVYQVMGELDSILINSQKVATPNGNYSTPRLVCDSTFTVCAFGPGGKDEVTVLIPVAPPVSFLDATITSFNIEYGETVRITWRGSNLKSLTLNNLPVPFTGSKDIVLTNDSTFVLRGIAIDDEVKTKTFDVEVGEKPTWKTFLEIGLNVTWKLVGAEYIPEGSNDWVIFNANMNDFQVIFMPDGTVQSYWTGSTWGYWGTWSFSGDILKFQGDAQILEINETELIIYYEKHPLGSNGQTTYVPFKFIYKKN